MLPPPENDQPLPLPSDAEFNDLSGEEDEALLATGLFDDDLDEDDDEDDSSAPAQPAAPYAGEPKARR